jgi:hypothetical protein
MRVFHSELWSAVQERDDQSNTLVLNWSKAAPFDEDSQSVLDEVRESCLAVGMKVVNIVRDSNELEWLCEFRARSINDGNEQYQLDESIEELAHKAAAQQRRAA